MTRAFVVGPLAAALCAALVSPAAAQLASSVPDPALITQLAAATVTQGEVHGRILDDAGEPLAGAVVSAVGATSAFAVSDDNGRFVFRELPFGPYLVRAHLKGYVAPQARLVQVDRASLTIPAIALASQDSNRTRVLAAGVGTAGVEPVDTGERPATDAPGDIDHGELSWRLRHLKRSILKSEHGDLPGDGETIDETFVVLGRAVGSPARIATAFLSDIPFSGEVNLLTTTSFDRPQDLFTSPRMPRGIAFLSLEAPTAGGQFQARGALTQGDLASWIVQGSYLRNADAAHRFEAGMSYGTQRYLGGNASALAAVADGARNVGTLYAYDQWAATRSITVGYGAKYSRYDYLADRNALSPRAHIVLTPTSDDTFTLRVSASRRVVAPGAEEFIPPSTGLWLPPERTFSPLAAGGRFTAEQINHLEVMAQRAWIGDILLGARVFRQEVEDQIVTVFGATLPDRAAANVGHYYVASAGDLSATGWGISVSRPVGDAVRASLDYTLVNARWIGFSRDAAILSQVAASTLRRDRERLHDLTASVDSVVPITATRVYVVYKINSAFADGASASGAPGVRFDVQLKQALPFLNFSGAEWEMLVAVRNMFREDLMDASVFDELLVVRPPKRVVGGVTVRF